MTEEKEGYLKKKSPKTQGKKVVDNWQKRCFDRMHRHTSGN